MSDIVPTGHVVVLTTGGNSFYRSPERCLLALADINVREVMSEMVADGRFLNHRDCHVFHEEDVVSYLIERGLVRAMPGVSWVVPHERYGDDDPQDEKFADLSGLGPDSPWDRQGY